ncbi:hypothetical protein D3C81_2200720 [compost metagenome]
MSRATLDRILLGETSFLAAVAAQEIRLAGDAPRFHALLEALEEFAGNFPVVEP